MPQGSDKEKEIQRISGIFGLADPAGGEIGKDSERKAELRGLQAGFSPNPAKRGVGTNRGPRSSAVNSGTNLEPQ